MVHLSMSEALERLLLTRYLVETRQEIPDVLTEYSLNPNTSVDEQLFAEASNFFREYEKYRNNVRTGSIGKTAQFWLLYMDLMRNQILSHNAVQTNNFDALLYGWKTFLPMYFAMNKVNYARYSLIQFSRALEKCSFVIET